MNTNWSKVLVFALLFGVAGFFIGRSTSHGCGDHSRGHMQLACCDKDGNCEHGGTCCKPGGTCDKAGCDHSELMNRHAGKACCKGGHGTGDGHHHGDGQGTNPDDASTDANVQQIVKQLEQAHFMGDTTIAIEGGEVHVSRNMENMEVKVTKHQ